MNAFLWISDLLTVGAWGLYLLAQWKGRIQASSVNCGLSAVMYVAIFLSTRSLSNLSVSAIYAINGFAVAASFLLTFKNPSKFVKSDIPLALVACACMSLVFKWPGAVVVISGSYTACSFTSYVMKVRSGVVHEWFLPWALWVAGGCAYLAGMGRVSPFVYINPIVNLVCWSAVMGFSLRAARRTGAPQRIPVLLP
jgi:hypothetical protein